MIDREAAVRNIEGLTDLQHVEGYVWCDKDGSVHTDTLNPFDYTDSRDWCRLIDHRDLYMEKDETMPTQQTPPGPVHPRTAPSDRKLLDIYPPISVSTFTTMLSTLSDDFPHAYVKNAAQSYEVWTGSADEPQDWGDR